MRDEEKGHAWRKKYTLKKVKKRKERKTATGSIKEVPEMTKMTAKGSGSWLNSRDRRCRQIGEKLNENCWRVQSLHCLKTALMLLINPVKSNKTLCFSCYVTFSLIKINKNLNIIFSLVFWSMNKSLTLTLNYSESEVICGRRSAARVKGEVWGGAETCYDVRFWGQEVELKISSFIVSDQNGQD